MSAAFSPATGHSWLTEGSARSESTEVGLDAFSGAVVDAARCLARGYEVLELAPLEVAVAAAFTLSGPPVDVLRARIVEYRARIREVVAS